MLALFAVDWLAGWAGWLTGSGDLMLLVVETGGSPISHPYYSCPENWAVSLSCCKLVVTPSPQTPTAPTLPAMPNLVVVAPPDAQPKPKPNDRLITTSKFLTRVKLFWKRR